MADDYATFGEAAPRLQALRPCKQCGLPQRLQRGRGWLLQLVLQNMQYHIECMGCGYYTEGYESIRQMCDDWDADEEGEDDGN